MRHPLAARGAAAVALLAALAAAPPAVAQPGGAARFRQLTIADGLSQNSVHAIEQDHRGFMWLGTKDGLDRYDGYDFLVFRHDPFDTTSISDSHITALREDGRGRLWIGTRGGGLNRFDRERHTFRRYPSGPRQPITSLAEGADGSLWIGTDGGGLYRLPAEETDSAQPSFDRFTHAPADPGALDHDVVHAVLVDRRGVVWVGTEAGLNRRDPQGPRARGFVHYTAHTTPPLGLADRSVDALYEDRDGRLWIGSASGLGELDPDRRRIVHHHHRYRTHRYGWGAPVAILETRDGLLWVSTRSELMRFDPGSGRFRYFRHDPRDPQGINSDVPTALYEDRSGVSWVGTNGFGVNLYDPKADRFHTFRRPGDRPYRVSGFSVYTLFEDSAGRIWIGAGVLYRWDRATGEFKSFETTSERPDDFGNTGVWSLLEQPPGFLWAGTYQGLYHYRIATGEYRQFRHDPADPGGLPEKDVYGVHRDRKGRLWVVTENYLAELVDPTRGRFRAHLYKETPTAGEWAFPSLYEDDRGVFWLASSQGLVRFDPESGALRRYRNDPTRRASLSHDMVRSIRADPSQPSRFLWIGTAGGGLNRLDLENETFAHFTQRDGLPNDVVYGVLPDGSGRLWLSTNKGLSRFDPSAGEFRNYDAADGLQSDEFNSGAYFRSASGELFFGGLYGFTSFHPEEVRDNPHAPPIVLTGLRLGNRVESVRDSGTALSRAISESDSLRLSYRDDLLTLHFAALDYSAPNKNRYAYRLVGFNDRWIEAGAVRSATYTNLPPGSYTFQVRGTNNDGVWNEEGASLTITVAPPLWRTGPAYALYGVLLFATLYALRRYEVNRLRLKSHLALERMRAEQLSDLERARSRFFADVSHEFRTPLTLTLGPLDDIEAGRHGDVPPAMREQVELARRNAGRVLDLINQILEVARLESGRARLRARPLDLVSFVHSVAAAFGPLAARRLVSFDVQAPADPARVYADPEQLEKVISNLLSNAFKFTPEGGAIRVAVESDAANARVTVRDSGPGIPAAELAHVFERFHRGDQSSRRVQPGTGIGLALAREIVELHGGSLSVHSEEGFGSTFTVTLPRGKTHLAPEHLVPEVEAHPWTPPASLAEPGQGSGAGVGSTETVGSDGTVPDPEGAADEDVTTVLVIEDNPEVRAYVRRHLEPAYRVLEAEDGESGLAAARLRLPDLILCDVMMPGMDGHSFCRALKTDPETDFIPVVLLTARATQEDRLAGLRERADDYLTKPFDVRELLARVENLIAARRRLRERFGDSDGSRLELHPSAVDVQPAEEKFLERVRAAIEAGLGDETFSVERLAREVAHSRGHLHRRLRALVDESPSDLIRRMRLERAAQLLGAGAGSVAEVAYSVGFKSVAHFSNRFQDHFGVRPSGYRASRAGRAAAGAPEG